MALRGISRNPLNSIGFLRNTNEIQWCTKGILWDSLGIPLVFLRNTNEIQWYSGAAAGALGLREPDLPLGSPGGILTEFSQEIRISDFLGF